MYIVYMVYIVYAMYAVYRSLPPVVRGGWTEEPTPYPPIPLGGGGAVITDHGIIYIYSVFFDFSLSCYAGDCRSRFSGQYSVTYQKNPGAMSMLVALCHHRAMSFLQYGFCNPIR